MTMVFKCCTSHSSVTKLDIYVIFNPVVIVSSIGGVCTIWRKKNQGVFVFNSTSAAAAFIIIVATILHLSLIPTGIFYVQWSRDSNSTMIPENGPEFVTKLINPISVSITAIAIRIASLIHTNKYLPLILSIIHNTDEVAEIKEARLRLNSRYIKMCIVILFIVSFPFQLYSVTLTGQLIHILLFGVNLYNTFSSTCCELQFVILCYIIYTRFQLIHRRLSKFVDTPRKIPGETISKISVRRQQVPQYRLEESTRIADKICILKKYHVELCNACQYLNKAYNIHLLFSITCCCLNVLLNFYYSMYGGFVKVTLTRTVFGILNGVFWATYYLVRFVSICTAADYVIKEANSTKMILCSIMNRNLSQGIKEEVWSFLNYSMCREVVFTACGFFQVNFTLITSAIATGTTYLVILAQFQQNCSK